MNEIGERGARKRGGKSEIAREGERKTDRQTEKQRDKNRDRDSHHDSRQITTCKGENQATQYNPTERWQPKGENQCSSTGCRWSLIVWCSW